MQALAKDVPWRLKGPRVLEIIEAVCCLFYPVCHRLVFKLTCFLGVCLFGTKCVLFSVCGVC